MDFPENRPILQLMQVLVNRFQEIHGIVLRVGRLCGYNGAFNIDYLNVCYKYFLSNKF